MRPQKPLNIDYASPGMIPPKRRRGLIGWILFVGLAVMFVLLMRQQHSNFPLASLSRLSAEIEAGDVPTVHVSDNELWYMSTSSSSAATNTGFTAGRYKVVLPEGMGKDWTFLHYLMQPHNGRTATVIYDGPENNLVINLLLPLIPWLLIFGFIWFFVFRQLRNKSGQPQRPTPVVIVNPEALQ